MTTPEIFNEIWENGAYRGGSTCLRLLPFLREHIPGGSVVNDYGAGTGRAEKDLLQFCSRVNMVDFASVALELEARALIGDRLSYTVAALERLPPSFPVADWGICINVLMTADPAKLDGIMAEMRRTCRNLIVEVYDWPDVRLGRDLTTIKGDAEFWAGEMRKHWPVVESYPSPEHHRRYITIGKGDSVDCDIIIPTYENEKFTIACLTSIKECTDTKYRVIWVDNGSEAMSGVAKAIEGMPHIAIRLEENRGFVGAINAGLAESNAPTICLLNNDTEVSKGWLRKLISALYKNKDMGIVGCLTGPPVKMEQYDSHHNIAYQQRFRKVPIFPEFIDLANFNEKIEKQLPGMMGKVDFVAFLCACIKREVIDKVGLLDPNYDMGMWDDADYGRSAAKAGYKSELTLDTCILHWGRSTFNLRQREEAFDVDALLAKNRAYLDKKWGAV